jgi:hypothetical protein
VRYYLTSRCDIDKPFVKSSVVLGLRRKVHPERLIDTDPLSMPGPHMLFAAFCSRLSRCNYNHTLRAKHILPLKAAILSSVPFSCRDCRIPLQRFYSPLSSQLDRTVIDRPDHWHCAMRHPPEETRASTGHHPSSPLCYDQSYRRPRRRTFASTRAPSAATSPRTS